MVRHLAIFKALAHKTRLQIVLMLRRRSLCVYQITELIGCSMATISAHLKVLKDVQLIDSQKVDQHVYYNTNCLSCGEDCNICQMLDGLVLDEQTLDLLRRVEQKFPPSDKIYDCENGDLR